MSEHDHFFEARGAWMKVFAFVAHPFGLLITATVTMLILFFSGVFGWFPGWNCK